MTGAWHIGLFAAPVPPPYIAPAVQMPCRGARRGLARRPRRARACSRMWPGGWCCDNASSQSRCCAGVARRVMGHRRRTASGPLCGAAPGTAHVGAAHLPLDVPVALLAEYRLRGGRRARSGRMPGCSGRRTPAQARPPPRSSSAPVIWPNPGDRQQRAEHTPLHPTATRIQAASNRRWSPLSRSEPRTVSAQGGVQRSDGGTRAPATDATGDGRESGAHNVPGTSAQGGGRPGHDTPRDRRARSRRITPCGREPPRPGT